MGDDLKRAVGARVRAARVAAGLTQEVLAAKVGRTPESLSNIERGKQLPTLDTIRDLTRALDVDPALLLSDLGRPSIASRQRADLEAKAQALIQSMTETDLAVAVRQLEAFVRR